MATRTISNAGGNSSSTGAWVEGIVPVNGDAVVATGTSGNLTIDASLACTSIILTNYVGTMTFNATLTVAGTVTFVAGMTISGTSDLICTTTATLTSGGKTLTGGLQLQGTSQTFTLSGAWIINGTLNFNGTTGTVLNSSTLSCGGLTVGVAVTGTVALTLTGGTWSGSGSIVQNLTFAGNVTISGTVNYKTGTLTYSSGSITTTGSTLTLIGSTTFNTAGMSWNNITVSGITTGTFTFNSLLTATGTFTSNQVPTFTGSSGFTVGTLAGTLTLSRTWTFASTKTYTVTSSLAITGATASVRAAFVASTPGSKAILTLQSGADSFLGYVDPTDIDSSGGIPIYTYKGTVTTSTNWVAGSLTLPSAANVKTGSGTYGYSDAAITPTGPIIIARTVSN